MANGCDSEYYVAEIWRVLVSEATIPPFRIIIRAATYTQQNDSTSSVSLVNRLYDEKRSTADHAPRHGRAKCCFRHPRRTGRIQREHDHLGTPEHPQTPALADVLAVRLEYPPAGLVSVPVLVRAAARDQRLPQRREQRRQTTHTVGDGALGKIQPMRAQIRQQPVRGPVQQILVDQHRHPRCPGCPSGSAVAAPAPSAAAVPPRTGSYAGSAAA